MRSATRGLTRRPNIRLIGIAAMILLLPLAAAQAQDQDTTFTVTVGDKTDDHPFNGQGFSQGFAIDGDQGAELTLQRGTTYLFVMDDTPSIHPFYITTSEVGAGADSYDQGVTNNGATGSQQLTFTPSAETPDLLYYQCTNHQFMGYRINVTGEATDAEGTGQVPDAFRLYGNHPNPFAESTRLRFDVATASTLRGAVYDVLGRRVATLFSGTVPAHRTRSVVVEADDLPAGLYLVRFRAGDVQQSFRLVKVR